MGVRFTGDWDRALELSKRSKEAVSRALQDEVEGLADRLREGIATGAPAGVPLAPLHPLTAALKGSTVPLAGMEKWVTARQVGPYRYFVGIVDPEGVRIGTIHEEGRSWTQVWSARQRRWFFAMLAKFGLLDPSRERRGGTGDEHLHVIPARPWLQPVADRYLPGAQQRLADAVVRAVLR